MPEKRQNLIVGLFAVISLMVLASLILMFGDVLSIVALHTYRVNVIFPQGATTSLREGTAVTLNGKRIGQTTAIDFKDPDAPALGIRVAVAVEGRYTLPLGCHAAVQTSVMGFGRPALQFIVDATAGTQPLPRDGTAEILGAVVPMLDQLIKPQVQSNLEVSAQQIGQLAESLTPVAQDLHRLMEVRPMAQVDGDATQRLTANLYTAVQRLDLTLKSFNNILADPKNQDNVTASLANIRKISDDLKVAAEDFRGFSHNAKDVSEHARGTIAGFDQTMEAFRTTVDTTGRKLGDVADASSRFLRDLDRSAVAMNEGRGTLGLMLNDNRLYESLVLTSERMTKAIDELRDILTLMRKGELKYRLF